MQMCDLGYKQHENHFAYIFHHNVVMAASIIEIQPQSYAI